MKTTLRLAGALLVTLAIALSSREARALGPIDIEVGAKVGYGTNPNAGPGGVNPNPLGVGLGGRGGITFFGIYAGVNAVDYLGSGDNLGGIYHAVQVGGELGYTIKVSILTLRPQIGLGNITLSDSQANLLYPGGSSFYLEPGGTALLTFGLIFVGADVNALVITSEPGINSGGSLNTNTATQTSLTIHGQVGLSF
jgi:hypothetical protein